jgi:hypothetical protein
VAAQHTQSVRALAVRRGVLLGWRTRSRPSEHEADWIGTNQVNYESVETVPICTPFASFTGTSYVYP